MTRERPVLRAVCAALGSWLLVASVPAPALARTDPPEEPAPLPEAPAPEADTAPVGGTRVHILNTRPEDDVGVVKLARYRGSEAAAVGNALIVTTRYEDLCTEPCGVPVDASERPIFFLVRDGRPVSHAFRLPAKGEVTLKFKPPRQGLWSAGVLLTCFLILPAGIPMIVVGKSKLFIADGPPTDDQAFTRVPKAKL